MSIVRQFTALAVSTEQIILTADANNAQNIFALMIGNRSGVDTDFIIRDASGGSTVMRLAVKAGTSFGFNRPLNAALLQSAKNNNWTIQANGANTFDVTVEATLRPA